MGAAAFLMVEYVGISYVEVIKHAFLPAIISYIALVYIVHLEACKMGLKGMERPVTKTVAGKLLSFVFTVLSLIIIGGAPITESDGSKAWPGMQPSILWDC